MSAARLDPVDVDVRDVRARYGPAALSILLVALGLGAWAVTVRLTAQTLVKTLGEKAAKAAFKAF